jgi:methyl-accepting chemotaxis protein
MKFKKLSLKVTATVVLAVFVVGVALAAYYQTRVVILINQHSQESLRNEISTKVGDYNLPFTDSIYIVKSLRNFTEANFDVASYKADPQGYFDSVLRPVTEPFVINTVLRSYFIDGAYISIDPDLSGNQYIGEVFVVAGEGEGEYEVQEAYDYDMYDENDIDMEWFFAPFKSGEPVWTKPYVDAGTGGTYVSYVEPVVSDGEVIGVVGIDISIAEIKDLVKDYSVYTTGFALIAHEHGFFETNDFITSLAQSEKTRLDETSYTVADGYVFDVTLDGTPYKAIKDHLANDYDLFILVPSNEYNHEAWFSTIRMVLIFPVVLIVVVVLSFFIGSSISKPIVLISKHLVGIGQGNYIDELPVKTRQIPDEVGNLARVSHDLRIRLGYLTGRVKTISEHNLTETVELAFQGDTAAIALNETLDTLNEMFGNLNIMAEELQSEASNLSDGSTTLADGCSEQTNAVSELMTAMEHIVSNTKDNMALLEEALKIENIVKKDAQAGDDNMRRLTVTVREINEASQDVHKILKAIEDIAFQTNILALNAAVEAARAGQHGKGFSVVAEEVRNLAAKSAAAAKETANLVGVSTQKAKEGEELANVTAESLFKIIEGINSTEEIIQKIEQNSHKNDTDISIMNKDLNIVSDITQRTAATAEETAAMSDEMTGQADALKDIISVFRVKGRG